MWGTGYTLFDCEGIFKFLCVDIRQLLTDLVASGGSMKPWVPISLTAAHPEDLGMLSFRRPVLGSKSPVMPCPILWYYFTYMWPSDTLGGTAAVNASSFQEKDLGGRERFLFMATLLSDSSVLLPPCPLRHFYSPKRDR